MTLHRTPAGKFIDRGSLLSYWLPVLLDWSYGRDQDRLASVLLHVSRWASNKAAMELERTAALVRDSALNSEIERSLAYSAKWRGWASAVEELGNRISKGEAAQ